MALPPLSETTDSCEPHGAHVHHPDSRHDVNTPRNRTARFPHPLALLPPATPWNSAPRLRLPLASTTQSFLCLSSLSSHFFTHKENRPCSKATGAVQYKCLTMTYSHMEKLHTTIGAKRFHFRVRHGIGWFTLAMVVRRNGGTLRCLSLEACGLATRNMNHADRYVVDPVAIPAVCLRKPLGCYMVKPHGQLVLVSSTHCCASTPSLSTL